MYSVCYVIIDSSSLRIYNEMMISISSLRYYGYKGRVLVVTDYQTAAFLKAEDFHRYGVEIVVAEVPDRYDQLERSRFIKTSLRQILTGDYLYVDTDTVFADLLPGHISDEEIAMVTDGHYDVMIPDTSVYHWAEPLSKKSGKTLVTGKPYYNSGIAWVRDTENARSLYENWHRDWLDSCEKGVPQDQTSLNYVNHQMGHVIKGLENRFNVQIFHGETIPFSLLSNAIIIHYGHPKPDRRMYLLSLPEINNDHFESDPIRRIIRSPKTAFIDGEIITAQDYVDFYPISKTYHYKLLRRIYRSNVLFKANERILALIDRFRRILSSK